jgi:ATP-binding cassette subfamily F protein uup
MDEPTNDLDIETLELLEELLLNYQGTLLLVSHDRSFINNIVTSCIAFEGNANVNEYVGGYDDWLRQRPLPRLENQKKTSQKSTTKAKTSTNNPPKNPPSQTVTKLSYNEQRELDKLPELIENHEIALNTLHDTMASTDFYNSAPDTITKTQNKVANIQKKLDLAYERWEALENQ